MYVYDGYDENHTYLDDMITLLNHEQGEKYEVEYREYENLPQYEKFYTKHRRGE